MTTFVPSGLDANLEQQLLLLQRHLAKVIAGASGGSVVYRPGAPSEGNCLATWAEVMAVVSQSERAAIFVDTSRQVPIGTPAQVPVGTWDMRFAILGSVALPTSLVVLEMADGAVLDNLAGIRDGLELRCAPTTGPCFTYSSFPGVPWVFFASQGALVDNRGTVPAIQVGAGETIIVAASIGGNLGPEGGPCLAPLVNLQAGALAGGVSFNGYWADNWLSGDAGSAASYFQVTSDFPSPPPNNPLFAGTLGPVGYLERALGVIYSPAIPADWNNDPPETVAEALDRIAAQIGPIT